MGDLLSLGGGWVQRVHSSRPMPPPPSPLFIVVGGRLACPSSFKQNAFSSVTVRGRGWPSWPLWEAGFRLTPTPQQSSNSPRTSQPSSLQLSLLDSFSQPHLGSADPGAITMGSLVSGS